MNQQQTASESSDCTYIPYQQTGFYSKTILDYLDKQQTLHPFYKHEVSVEGIKAAIEERKAFPQNREVLVNVLKQQYQNLQISDNVQQNINLLSQPNTYTITTAHQPVIFTGPLYFAYKILHAVKLAEELSKQLPQNNFVPVFYMGSEDADLDELGTIKVDGKEYKWQTKQTGAVGRMKIDNDFITLLQQLQNQIAVLPFGDELIDIFKQCYRLDITIQQATLEVINELFGKYGVVVLIPDNPGLKRLLQPVFIKEIQEQFSHKQVEETLAGLSQYYKVQAGGRELNLFYLLDDKRERIEAKNDKFIVQSLELIFTREELINEIKNHPERFSPNVILRGVLQETVLPNIAFIGGGGEMAYWLELKKVFDAVQVPYPVLILRNSFLFTNKKQAQKLQQLGFSAPDFFNDTLSLINDLVKRTSDKQITIESEIQQAKNLFSHLQSVAQNVDITLQEHATALSALMEKKLKSFEKKIMRAERKKYDTQHNQIETIKQQLFPNKNLQERVENISGFYPRYGKSFLDIIYQNSLSLEQQFAIVTL